MRLTPWRKQQKSADAELSELSSGVASAFARGKPSEAQALARAVMDAHADAGPGDDLYLTAWTSWANALGHTGQHAAAAREYTTMIDTVGPVIGHDHARVLIWHFSRAGSLDCLARYEEAESDCRAAMEISATVQPASYGVALRIMATNHLITALLGQGMSGEAESLARAAIAEAVASKVISARVVVALRRSLAGCLNAQERYAEAEEIMQAMEPERPGDIARVRLPLGTAQLGLGQAAEAEASAREAVRSAGSVNGPHHYLTLRAGTLLGAAVARQGNLDEARRLLEVNAAAWAEHFGSAHPKTIDAQRELAKTYDASP